MSAPLLATKLYAPPPRPNAIARARLIAQLNAGLHRKLTLVSAPAGFGKTTLVSAWLAVCGRSAAWLSLEAADSDPNRFLAYLVAALQTLGLSGVEGRALSTVERIAPDIGKGVLLALQSPQPPPLESLLAALLNELAAIPEPAILVLDDYHVLDAKAVDDAVAFLLEHLPPRMHLVITTREDPSLPLPRLRARGQLTELRAADLRFTPAEAAEFLNRSMGLSLSVEEVAVLEARTEGWIAGLQLAALSIRGAADTGRFIQSFTGSHRFVLDYLVAEVLEQQPADVQAFLLRTSILDRLCGPLCDAVLPAPAGSGQAKLEYLERANLFIVPLDDERRWYRYHHLFADLLRQRLPQDAAADAPLPALHVRASVWYEAHGLDSEAVQHALAAGDFSRVAGLAELAWPAMDGRFQSAAWFGWVKSLPAELVRARPVLSVAYAWALLNAGNMEAAEPRLQDAERWLDTSSDLHEPPPAPATETHPESFDFAQDKLRRGTHPEHGRRMVVVDQKQFQTLPASIATARAYIAQARGDVPGTVKYAGRALALLAPEDHLRRGPAAALLGLAHWTGGDLEAAHHALAEAMANFQRVGSMHFAISGTYGLADIRITQGRLRDAIAAYEASLRLVAEQGEPVLRGTANLYLGLCELHRAQGHPAAAAAHLLHSEQLGEPAALSGWTDRLRRVKARSRADEADLDGALALLDEAERHYHRSPVPDVQPIAALKARVWVAQGRLPEARAWAAERGLTADDTLSYLREFEHITLARLLIAEARRDPASLRVASATRLLARLLRAAEAGGRTGSVIELLLLQALAHEAQRDVAAALVPLARALALAEPEGYVRIFVDEGRPMAQLLTRLKADPSATPAEGLDGRMNGYIDNLLASFGTQDKVHPSSFIPHPFIEPLSPRELEILRLMAQGLSNREIGERLFLALNTVKGHNQKIFAKLQVQRRTEAVARARALGLL